VGWNISLLFLNSSLFLAFSSSSFFRSSSALYARSPTSSILAFASKYRLAPPTPSSSTSISSLAASFITLSRLIVPALLVRSLTIFMKHLRSNFPSLAYLSNVALLSRCVCARSRACNNCLRFSISMSPVLSWGSAYLLKRLRIWISSFSENSGFSTRSRGWTFSVCTAVILAFLGFSGIKATKIFS